VIESETLREPLARLPADQRRALMLTVFTASLRGRSASSLECRWAPQRRGSIRDDEAAFGVEGARWRLRWLRTGTGTGARDRPGYLRGGRARCCAAPNSYQSVLSQGQGSFFAAAPLQGPEGRVGTVVGYQGQPSWVMVTLQSPIQQGGPYHVQVVTSDGRYLSLGETSLGEAGDAWGQQLPVDLSAMQQVRLLGPDGTTTMTATFDAANPWGLPSRPRLKGLITRCSALGIEHAVRTLKVGSALSGSD
jgi:hypothetical protein